LFITGRLRYCLFEQRKQRRMRIHWVEENNTYRGKPLRTKKKLMPA
jgi:hypothetical protein